MRGRDVRRWLLDRVRRRVVRWALRWGMNTDASWLTAAWVGRTSSHHHTCPMCGNRRKGGGGDTVQERQAERKWHDWLEGDRW